MAWPRREINIKADLKEKVQIMF